MSAIPELFTAGGRGPGGVRWDGQAAPMADNAFCATGKGGGVDASCGKGGTVIGKAEHVRAAQIEREVASAVGGKQLDDNEPSDVEIGNHALEVKSFQKGAKNTITAHPDALYRKAKYAEETGKVFHTVAVDVRSGKREMYYKRGAGRYALSKMHRTTEAEVRKLLDTPDKELPEAARGSLPPARTLKAAAEAAHAARLARDRARKKRMATNVQFRVDGETDGPFQAATTRGWTELSEAIEQLPDGFPALKEFMESGEYEGTDELSEELSRALPALSGSVRRTAEQLLERIGIGAADEVAEVVE